MFTGSFRLSAATPHLHSDFKFTESRVETVGPALRHSCRSELHDFHDYSRHRLYVHLTTMIDVVSSLFSKVRAGVLWTSCLDHLRISTLKPLRGNKMASHASLESYPRYCPRRTCTDVVRVPPI